MASGIEAGQARKFGRFARRPSPWKAMSDGLGHQQRYSTYCRVSVPREKLHEDATQLILCGDLWLAPNPEDSVSCKLE
jgi:hypothetical protein